MSTTHRHISTKRIALLGVLTGLALVAGYVEVIFPLPVSVPGVKLGLGNVVVLFALERLSARDALWLMLAKVSASALLFGNPQVLMFSLAGGALSWAVMSLARKSGFFSTVSVSVLGGLSHNAGQLALVACMLSPAVALLNLPVLAISGVAAGAAIGLIVRAALAALPFEEPKELR
ncbi:MAG: Gx transporter family protein [Coriobacteriaceae bacterium]|nr:Gx transporter family protein [Coriobacteriaceae bacterium]